MYIFLSVLNMIHFRDVCVPALPSILLCDRECNEMINTVLLDSHSQQYGRPPLSVVFVRFMLDLTPSILVYFEAALHD